MDAPFELALMILFGSLLVGTSVRVFDRAVARVSEIRAKDDFVRRFVGCAAALVDDLEFPSELKDLVMEIAEHIQDRRLADTLSEKSKENELRNLIEDKFQNLIAAIHGLNQKQQEHFFSAIFFFMIALSYSSRHGRHLRRRMMRNVSNRRVVIKESLRAYQATGFHAASTAA